jgi:4a-hydroxytetrahydrobiopterin dehydratase
MMAPDLLDAAEIEAGLSSLSSGWTGTTERLKRSIEFADFPTAAEFVSRLAPVCEELDHHPDLALRWRWVDIELSTHSAKGVTELDLKLAGEIDEVVARLPLADQSAGDVSSA